MPISGSRPVLEIRNLVAGYGAVDVVRGIWDSYDDDAYNWKLNDR